MTHTVSPHKECMAHCAMQTSVTNLEDDVKTLFRMVVPRWVFMAACALVIICLGYITHVAAENRKDATQAYERLVDKIDTLQSQLVIRKGAYDEKVNRYFYSNNAGNRHR